MTSASWVNSRLHVSLRIAVSGGVVQSVRASPRCRSQHGPHPPSADPLSRRSHVVYPIL